VPIGVRRDYLAWRVAVRGCNRRAAGHAGHQADHQAGGHQARGRSATSGFWLSSLLALFVLVKSEISRNFAGGMAGRAAFGSTSASQP